jgi:broad specificity phosphatase PhoE
MKTIYFVRHGESDANIQGIISGSELDAQLTEKGQAQATATGKDLRDKGIQLIVCSPMSRTIATATLIAKAIGYDPKDIVKNAFFIERSFGELSGKSSEPYREAFRTNQLPASTESSEAMHIRISKGFAWLKTLKEDHIVVVSHGATGRMVKVISQELHHSQMEMVDRLDNGEIYTFNL